MTFKIGNKRQFVESSVIIKSSVVSDGWIESNEPIMTMNAMNSESY